MKTTIIIPAWAMLNSQANAVDVTFMEGKECSAYAVSGASCIPSITCYNISAWDGHQSVDVRNFFPNQLARFFSDTTCNQEVYSTATDGCYDTNNIVAFTVQNVTALVTNQDVETEESITSDVVPYNMKLSNYQGMELRPNEVNIPLSNFQIGVLALATASLVNFAALGLGCYSAIMNPTPDSIFGCVAPPVVSILTYVSVFFFGRQGARAQGHIDVRLGRITDTPHAKRQDVIDAIDGANFEYVHSMMNVTGSPATHNGIYMKRDFGRGEQTSPLYEFKIPNSNATYHFTAFWDETSASFVHHMTAAENMVVKRQTDYNDIRWSQDGLDFSVCQRNAGSSTSIFEKDMETLFDELYSEFTCTVDRDAFLNDQQLVVDLYNEESTLVAEVHIAGYKDGGPVNNNAYVITECTDQHGSLNQQCVA